MTSPKTIRVLMVLALLGSLASLCHAVEPAQGPTLVFKFDSTPLTRTRKKTAQPTILPTHTAFFCIEWYHRAPTPPDMNAVLQTNAGRSISQLQREFMKTAGDITSIDTVTQRAGNLMGIRYIAGKTRYEVLAVSREDAQKMAQAYIEVLLRQNNAALKPLLDEYLGKFQDKRSKYQQDIAKAQQGIPERQKELKDLQAQFADLKKKQSYQSLDQAQKAIEELNTVLNTERVELAGLQAKDKAIERYRREVEQKVKSRANSLITSWEPILLNLVQKYIDLMIDLDVAKAREKTALELRQQAQAFLDLSDKVDQADKEVDRLQHDVSVWGDRLRNIDQVLADPRPPMLPLQILDNQVFIRPVTIKFAE